MGPIIIGLICLRFDFYHSQKEPIIIGFDCRERLAGTHLKKVSIQAGVAIVELVDDVG